MWYRLRALFRRAHMERELSDEMQFHAATTGRAVELEATAEACRDARGVSWVENTVRDVRYVVRSLRHTPGFTIPALLTLALGLGAAIAIFSVADAVLLQPLAYPGAGRLVELRESIPLLSKTPIAFSAPDFAEVRAAGTAFAQVASFEEGERDLSIAGGSAQRVEATRVSANLFAMLGAHPLLGHAFTPEQDTPGHAVAILSNALWRKSLGSNPDVVGRSIHLGGAVYTVVGVMPAGFDFPPRGLPDHQPADVFVPMAFTPAELSGIADDFDVGVLARLRPGATVSEARAQMAIASQRILDTWTHKLGAVPGLSLQVTIDGLRNLVIGPARALMDLLLGAAALLLLLSCANAANLFLVRASTRRREWSLRSALGASGGRLVRQSLAEASTLSVAAAAAGLLLAWGFLRLLTTAAPVTLPQVRAIGLNVWAVGFALVLALIVAPLCGLLPALAARDSRLERGLREDAPSLAGGGRGARARQGLVMAQVAIAFVLVCGAGLLIRSFVRAESQSGGFAPAGVTTASLLLPQAQYKPGAGARFWSALHGKLAAQPGFSSAALTTVLPTQPNWTHTFTIAGHPHPAGAPMPKSSHALIAGQYFTTFGIPIVQGRGFTSEEALGNSAVVIVNAALARHYWPHGSAVGQRITWGVPGPGATWFTIVGVAGDVKEHGLDQPSGYQTYSPYRQTCDSSTRVDVFCRNFYIGVRGRGAGVLPLQRLVASVDPGVPVTDIRSLSAVLSASITPRRFNTLLLAVFGVAALLLAAIGLYGVLAFAVTGRKRELAVRLALGAEPAAVARMVVGIGGRLALAGLALGALGAWMLAGVLHASLGGLLYRTAMFDPLTWIGVAVLLLLVAVAAAYLPARRASRIPPLQALREN